MIAAGTINQIARGLSSFFTRSAIESALFRAEAFDRLASVRARVGTHAIVTRPGQAADEPCSHSPQTDHSQLHPLRPFG